MADYIYKVKSLNESKASTCHAPTNDELFFYMFADLGSEYDSIVTSLTTCVNDLTFNDVYAHLMTFEMRLDQHNTVVQFGSSANSAIRHNSNSSRGG